MTHALTSGCFALIIIAAFLARPVYPPILSATSQAQRIGTLTEETVLTHLPSGSTEAKHVLKLPDTVAGIKEDLDAWVNLEIDLLFDLGSRPYLLERYHAEKDPAYKGLLAVLLSAHPSTHEMILADLLGTPGQSSEVFRALALYALVKVRPLSPAHRHSVWQDLLSALELNQLLPDFDLNFWCSVEGTQDSSIRCLLEAWPDSEKPLVKHLVHSALSACARDNADYAAHLLHRAIDQTPDRLRLTLDDLHDARLHEREVLMVAQTARRHAKNPEIVASAATILGCQKSPIAMAELRSLHGYFSDEPGKCRSVMAAMSSHRASFEDVALSSLQSTDAGIRSEALHLLDRKKWRNVFIGTLTTDPDPEPRRVAADILWRALAIEDFTLTPDMEASLKSALEVDPDEEVRKKVRKTLAHSAWLND